MRRGNADVGYATWSIRQLNPPQPHSARPSCPSPRPRPLAGKGERLAMPVSMPVPPAYELHNMSGEDTAGRITRQGAYREPYRPHRKNPRYQARDRLDVEAYLRTDRRHVADADHQRIARANEIDQAASRQGGRAV